MNVKEMLSEKGKLLIVINNFKFYLHHTSKKDDTETWRCVNNKCSAKLKRLNGTIDFNHEHDPDTNLKRQIVTNNLKKNIGRFSIQAIERLTKLICYEVKNSTDEMGLKAIDETRVCRNIYNAKHLFLSKLPSNKNEVHTAISSMAWVTNRNEPFVFFKRR